VSRSNHLYYHSENSGVEGKRGGNDALRLVVKEKKRGEKGGRKEEPSISSKFILSFMACNGQRGEGKGEKKGTEASPYSYVRRERRKEGRNSKLPPMGEESSHISLILPMAAERKGKREKEKKKKKRK